MPPPGGMKLHPELTEIPNLKVSFPLSHLCCQQNAMAYHNQTTAVALGNSEIPHPTWSACSHGCLSPTPSSQQAVWNSLLGINSWNHHRVPSTNFNKHSRTE